MGVNDTETDRVSGCARGVKRQTELVPVHQNVK